MTDTPRRKEGGKKEDNNNARDGEEKGRLAQWMPFEFIFRIYTLQSTYQNM